MYDAVVVAYPMCTFTRKMRDKAAGKTLQKIFADVVFLPKLRFVLWYTDWLGELERWGGSCSCHQDAYRAGMAVECWRKGRLLQWAWPHAVRELRLGLREAESWGPDEYAPLPLQFVDTAQGAARLAHGLALEKLKHLDRLPYLLARWGEGGVKEQALAQFSSVQPQAHEPLTLEFLAEGSRLRATIDRCSESEALQDMEFSTAIARIRCIPLDDSRCEAPHARAGRVGGRSRRAKWPWIASDVRLEQNLHEFDSCSDNRLKHTCWKKAKAVLQLHPRKQHRAKKVSLRAAWQSFYWIPSAAGFAEHIEDLHIPFVFLKRLVIMYHDVQLQ